ncbi:hypothetical protein ThidrDRAFT_1860 [Thiorhodococcus drewsii AZ1]|uniref:Green heme protein n=1 Tax=Thiorhodococcus drewsii AZ1 TaxID=765913 RepID=G2E0N7_9GAMM|nr:hypothetical protein [Thiorhodococcus drewsii]EGV31659.1 hypothetical protein ThidrDRAFT_1860 [Thiorhodococcus drewsii AZ1]
MTQRHHLRILACTGLLVCAVNASAEESAETLYKNHCLGCHGSEVYTRTNHKITSFEGLKSQVQRCELGLGLQWFDEDVDQIASYLNQHFYHFAN